MLPGAAPERQVWRPQRQACEPRWARTGQPFDLRAIQVGNLDLISRSPAAGPRRAAGCAGTA
jgi:hypothetical protein